MQNRTVVSKLENKTTTPAVIIAIVFTALVLGGVTAMVIILVLNNDTESSSGVTGNEARDLFTQSEIAKLEAFRSKYPAAMCQNSFDVSGIKFCETDIRPCSSSKVRALKHWRTVSKSSLQETLSTLPTDSLKRIVGEVVRDSVILRFRDSATQVLSFFDDYEKSESVSIIAPRLTLALYSDYPEMGLIHACNFT
jgi:hypothetical protein